MKYLSILSCCLCLLLPASTVFAQKGVGNREGPMTIGGHVGAYSQGNGAWPKVGLEIDEGFGSFALRAELWGVSRPVTLCSGVSLPECDERKWIRGIALGGRLIDRRGDWHPYVGAGGGYTKYNDAGGMAYGELGVRYDLAEQFGLDVRTMTILLGDDEGIGGGTSLNIGVWYAIKR